MTTIVLCYPDGRIHAVRRSDDSLDEHGINADLPDDGFYIDLSGQKNFEKLETMDILTDYKVNAKTKKLVKLRAPDVK